MADQGEEWQTAAEDYEILGQIGQVCCKENNVGIDVIELCRGHLLKSLGLVVFKRIEM